MGGLRLTTSRYVQRFLGHKIQNGFKHHECRKVVVGRNPALLELSNTSKAGDFLGLNYSFIIIIIIYQIARLDMTFKYKLRRHFSDYWHCMDAVIFLLFFTAIYFRVNNIDEEFVNTSFSVTVFLSTLRFLKAFYVSKSLGPYVFMIAKMVGGLSYRKGF